MKGTNMNIRKLLSVILAAVLILPVFSACNNDPSDTTGDTAATVVTDTDEPATDTDEATTADTVTDPSTEPDTEPDTTAPATSEDTEEVTATDTDTEPSTDTVTDTDTDTGTVTETDPVTTPAAVTDAETTKPDTPQPPAQYGKPADLMFRQVYGTGYNNDTPASHSFIELYNTSQYPVKLGGLTLCSYDMTAKKYVYFDLPSAEVPASTSYLVRCAAAKGKNGEAYDETKQRVSVKYYDASWNVVLDNKEIRLALADKGTTISTDNVAQARNVYIYFIGSQTVTSDKNTAAGISKNKAAYRVKPGDKYILVDYKNAPASEIADRAPMCLKGDVNAQASALANVVSFSAESGFYDSTVELALTAHSGYTIYYTMDGSDPRRAGVKYTGKIKLTSTNSMSWGTLTKLCNSLNGSANPRSTRQVGAKVIKAYATNGKISTQVATNTYFIGTDILKYKMPILAMSIEPSEFLSSDRGIYHTQMSDPFGTKMRRTAFFEIMETNGERVSASYIEIALNGNGSLGFSAKSIRTYFKADAAADVVGNPSKLKYDIFQGKARDGVTEFKRLLLRNSGNDSSQTHLRDAYMQALCSTLDCPTMAYRPALLFINGELWGVYNIRERYDAKYFESHFGIPEEDFCMLESISPLITGSWNTAYALNDGVAGDEKPFHELVTYIENNNLADDNKFKYVADRIDLDNMIDFFVGSMFLCNTDWPGNNIKVWRNKNPENKNIDTKWRFAFCDMDMGVGLATNIDTNMFTHAINDGTVAGRIFNRMLRNESFKDRFINRFYECAETIFDTSVTLPLLEQMAAAIREPMKLHFNRWPSDGGSAANFENQINSVRYFMTNRRDRAISHLESFFHVTQKQFAVTFDEDAVSVKIDGKTVNSGYTVKFKGTAKISMTIDVKDGYELVNIKSVAKNGTVRNYNLTSITFNVDSTLNVTILTKRSNASAEPMVVTGSRAIFALADDGQLYAWGENDYGQLGINSGTVTEPTVVASDVKKVSTSMGGTEGDAPMTAILTSGGAVYTCGNNSAGQLCRDGSSYSFIRVELDFVAKDISCGFDHFVILAENGDLYGVGNNSYGQLGTTGFGENVTQLTKIETGVKMAAAGRRHTIYIKENGDLYVLGDNRWNKFNTSGEATLTTPYKLGENFAFCSTGQHNCLAIKTTGDLYYIGWRSVTTFNAGEASGSLEKIATGMQSAYIMDEHIIMLGRDGNVYGFGYNNFSQIIPDGQNKLSPSLIMEGCIGCGAGTHYSAAIRADGTLLVWGNNSCGVLGNGTVSDTNSGPVEVMRLQ